MRRGRDEALVEIEVEDPGMGHVHVAGLARGLHHAEPNAFHVRAVMYQHVVAVFGAVVVGEQLQPPVRVEEPEFRPLVVDITGAFEILSERP